MIIDDPVTPHHQTRLQFIYHHPQSAEPITVGFQTLLLSIILSPLIIRPYLSSFPVTVHHFSLFQFISHHPPSADPKRVHQKTLIQLISRHPPSADPIPVHFTSSPIRRPYSSSFHITPHQKTLLQFIRRPYYYRLSHNLP